MNNNISKMIKLTAAYAAKAAISPSLSHNIKDIKNINAQSIIISSLPVYKSKTPINCKR